MWRGCSGSSRSGDANFSLIKLYVIEHKVSLVARIVKVLFLYFTSYSWIPARSEIVAVYTKPQLPIQLLQFGQWFYISFILFFFSYTQHMIATLNTTFWYLQHGQFLYKMLKMNGRMTHCTYPCAPLLSLFFFSLSHFSFSYSLRISFIILKFYSLITMNPFRI